jgi:hypothetical protein
MLVDGQPRLIRDILASPLLCTLISDEGVIRDARYH